MSGMTSSSRASASNRRYTPAEMADEYDRPQFELFSKNNKKKDTISPLLWFPIKAHKISAAAAHVSINWDKIKLEYSYFLTF